MQNQKNNIEKLFHLFDEIAKTYSSDIESGIQYLKDEGVHDDKKFEAALKKIKFQLTLNKARENRQRNSMPLSALIDVVNKEVEKLLRLPNNVIEQLIQQGQLPSFNHRNLKEISAEDLRQILSEYFIMKYRNEHTSDDK